MAPIAHFNQSSSRSGVSIDIKKLDASHSARHLGDQQVEFQRSAAVEFALSQWKSISSRSHYTCDQDGIPVLVVALPMSNAEKQISAPIQDLESSFGLANSIKTLTKKSSLRSSPMSSGARNKTPASPPIVNRFYKSRTTQFNKPLVTRCSDESSEFRSNISWNDNTKYDTADTESSVVASVPASSSDSRDTPPSAASTTAMISITSSNNESNNKVPSQLSCSNLDAEIDENNAIISQKVSQFSVLIDAIEAEMGKFKKKDQIHQTETASCDADIDENKAIISQDKLNPRTILKLTDTAFLNSELVLQDMELTECYNKISDLQNEVTILRGNLEQLFDDREKDEIHLKDRPLTIYVKREWHDKEMEEFSLRATRDHNEFLKIIHGCADQAETLMAEHSKLWEAVAERDRIISDQRNDISMLRIDINSVTDAHMEELTERDRMISILHNENENLRARLTAAEAHTATIISQFPPVVSTPSKPPKTPFRKFKSNCSKVVRQTQRTLRGLLPHRN